MGIGPLTLAVKMQAKHINTRSQRVATDRPLNSCGYNLGILTRKEKSERYDAHWLLWKKIDFLSPTHDFRSLSETVSLESTRRSKPTLVTLFTRKTSIQKEYERFADIAWGITIYWLQKPALHWSQRQSCEKWNQVGIWRRCMLNDRKGKLL